MKCDQTRNIRDVFEIIYFQFIFVPITSSGLSLDPNLGVAVVECNVVEVDPDCGKGGLTSKIKFTNALSNSNTQICIDFEQSISGFVLKRLMSSSLFAYVK